MGLRVALDLVQCAFAGVSELRWVAVLRSEGT